MRKVVIGRGHDCDIVIPDTTDVVSRRQMAIAFNFMGKMTLYDLSTNGTFVNDVRIPKPDGVPVKPGDKITMGSNYNFDLRTVRDPYKTLRTVLFSALALIVVAAFIACAYCFKAELFGNGSKSKTYEYIYDAGNKPAEEDTRMPQEPEIKADDTPQTPVVEQPAAKKPAPKSKPSNNKKTDKQKGKTDDPAEKAPNNNRSDSEPVETDDFSGEKNI